MTCAICSHEHQHDNQCGFWLDVGQAGFVAHPCTCHGVPICEDCGHDEHEADCCEGMMAVAYRYGDAEARCSCDIGKDD